MSRTFPYFCKVAAVSEYVALSCGDSCFRNLSIVRQGWEAGLSSLDLTYEYILLNTHNNYSCKMLSNYDFSQNVNGNDDPNL